jgi:cell division protein FtsB
MSRKHTKYTSDYNKHLALLIPTTEKVKDAAGQEVEKNKIERLLSERTALNTEITKLEDDIKKSGGSYAAVRYLKKRIEL